MLYCSTPFLSFGPIQQGKPATFYFAVQNLGEQTYEMKPWSGCGCSTPILPKAEIVPGEIIPMQIIFDTIGKVGINEKSVGVFYGEGQRLNLKFKAEVVN